MKIKVILLHSLFRLLHLTVYGVRFNLVFFRYLLKIHKFVLFQLIHMRRIVSSWSFHVFVHKHLRRMSLHNTPSSQDHLPRWFTPIRRKLPPWNWNPKGWTRSYLVNPLILLCDTHPAALRRWILFVIYPVAFHGLKGKEITLTYTAQMTQYPGLELHHFRSDLS